MKAGHLFLANWRPMQFRGYARLVDEEMLVGEEFLLVNLHDLLCEVKVSDDELYAAFSAQQKPTGLPSREVEIAVFVHGIVRRILSSARPSKAGPPYSYRSRNHLFRKVASAKISATTDLDSFVLVVTAIGLPLYEKFDLDGLFRKLSELSETIGHDA